MGEEGKEKNERKFQEEDGEELVQGGPGNVGQRGAEEGCLG